LTHVTELWSKYGDLAELWFDGGLIPVNQGGPNVLPLLEKYQPNAVAFNAPEGYAQCARWIGNESGTAPEENWSTCNGPMCVNGGNGNQFGTYVCPSECDTPLRGNGAHQWFWEPDGELYLKTLDQLVEEYRLSVGHNCNFMLAVTPNRQGLVDAIDMQRYYELGLVIAEFSDDRALNMTSGTSTTIDLPLGKQPIYVDHVVLMEDMSFGERVYLYVIEAQVSGNWQLVANGTSIGHKKINSFPTVSTTMIRFVCLDSAATPLHIMQFAAFFIGN